MNKSEKADWKELKKTYYKRKTLVQTRWGLIDFNPDDKDKIVGAENIGYDEYLSIQRKSEKSSRRWFETCYYDAVDMGFKGKVQNFSKDRSKICFDKIFVWGCYGDLQGFDGREDHVWMDSKGFESYKPGTCLRFGAEVYKYLKTSNGKRFDYALRNPIMVEEIDTYEIPSDDDLLMQSIDQLICETCLFSEQCYGFCIANQEEREQRRKQLFALAKARKKSN